MPKRNAKSDPHAEEELDADCESDGGEDGERGQAGAQASHTLESRVGTPCGVPTCRSGIGADIVWLAGVLNVDIRSIQGTMIDIHLCALTLGI